MKSHGLIITAVACVCTLQSNNSTQLTTVEWAQQRLMGSIKYPILS